MELYLPSNARSSVSRRCFGVRPGRLEECDPNHPPSPPNDPSTPSVGLAAGRHWAVVGALYGVQNQPLNLTRQTQSPEARNT